MVILDPTWANAMSSSRIGLPTQLFKQHLQIVLLHYIGYSVDSTIQRDILLQECITEKEDCGVCTFTICMASHY